MKITMIQCDKCGKVHEKNDGKKFAERAYIGWGETYQFCKECAKTITLYEIIEKRALEAEKETT